MVREDGEDNREPLQESHLHGARWPIQTPIGWGGGESLHGDMVIVDLSSLNHMPSQQSVCSRRAQDLGDRTNLHVFALNEDDTLLMIPGAKMRVDTHKHMLGSPSLDRAIEN